MKRNGTWLVAVMLATVAVQAQTNQTEVQSTPPKPAMPMKEIWQVRRLDAPDFIKGKVLNYRGPIVRAVKSPKPAQLLQLVNPFAPTEHGAGDTHPVTWNPFAGPKTVPRAFRDPMTEESLPLLLIGK
jgi:hypothetical protein